MTVALPPPGSVDPTWQRVGLKLTRWAFFCVVISLLPIVAAFVFGLTARQHATVSEVLSKGELLLISVAIAGAAIGELIGQDFHRFRIRKVALIGLTFVIILFATLWFGSIASILAAHGDIDGDAIRTGSIVIFSSSIVAGVLCVAMSELGQRP